MCHTFGSHGFRHKKTLTGYVIVLPLEELQTPQVGAEFLKLERELYITVWFVAVQQRRVSLVNGAALQLTSRDQEDSVELLLSPRGSICPGAHNVHLVPYLWIQNETLTWSKPVIKERNTTLKKKKNNIKILLNWQRLEHLHFMQFSA